MTAADRRAKAVRRIADGLDIPPEMVGTLDTDGHWAGLASAAVWAVAWLWPTRRATAAHAYTLGACTGDTAACGAPLHGDHFPSIRDNDRRCTRCARIIANETSTP